MTEGSKQAPSRWLTVSPTLFGGVAATCLVALLGATACETVAQIPFSDRTFRGIYPVGITPAGGQCDGIVSSAGRGSATMRMIFLDNQGVGVGIKEGEEVSRAFVSPRREDFRFVDSGRLYSLPDVPCESDSACGSLNCMNVTGLGDRCQRNTGLSFTSDPEFVGQNYSSQAIAVAMANVGRWRGWFSSDFSGYYEWGSSTALPSQPLEDSAAVDRSGDRGVALRDMVRDWQSLNDLVTQDNRNAYLGLWTFGSSPSEVISRVQDPEPSNSMWTRTNAVGTAAAATTSSLTIGSGRSDIYASMVSVIEEGFETNPDLQNVDHREMVFVVAGHDERKRTDVETVIQRAQNAGVAVSVVQVDTPLQADVLRDDWVYYEDEEPCASDDECANFERCREPKRYTTVQGSTDEGDIEWPRPEQLGETFCLPTYQEDDEGMARLGPIADYQRLACETGGSYTYIPRADRELIHHALRAQVWSGEAGWEIDFAIDDIDRIDPDGDGAGNAFLLEGAMQVTIGRSNTYGFDYDGTRDRRKAFFTPAN